MPAPSEPVRPPENPVQDLDKRDLIAQWAFDTRPVLLRFHLWLEDVEVERFQEDPVSAHSFTPRGIARCQGITIRREVRGLHHSGYTTQKSHSRRVTQPHPRPTWDVLRRSRAAAAPLHCDPRYART